MEGIRINTGQDLMANFLNLVEQQGKMPSNHMMAMFGLYALVNILNLVQPEAATPKVTEKAHSTPTGKLDKDTLMETLNGLLKSQGINAGDLMGMLGGKSDSTDQSPGDLLGALGKNPAALMNFMNLLASAKEAMNASKKEERLPKKPEESKTVPFKERNP